MGYAILYCTGCSTQLRDPDFDRGAAFRFDGRVYCSKCAPADARAQAATRNDSVSTGTGKVPKVAPPSSTARIKLPETEGAGSSRWPLIAGGSLLAVSLIVALIFSGKDSPRPASNPAPTPPPPPPTVVQQKPDVTPPPPRERPLLTPVANDKEAEEAIQKARDHAKANPDDLAGQLALYDVAVRASALTGHAAAVVRERDAIQSRVKAMVKTRLDALDVSVKAAADREEFGPALKLIEEARAQDFGTDWTAEVDHRSQALHENANKLFAAVKAEAVEAQKRGADQDVRRLTDRVDKWGMQPLKTELAKAVATAKKPPPPPTLPKALEAYRKTWGEAMNAASFRDFATAVKKIEDVAASVHDPAVKAESASDLELLKQAISGEQDAIQLLTRTTKGQKLTLLHLTEAGRVETTGSLVRGDPGEIELATEKGRVRIPTGEITSRSLGQLIREKRPDKGPAVLCLIDGDVEGAKGLAEGAAAFPDKYWSFKSPPNGPAQAQARRLFYSAELDFRSHRRMADALEKYATLLKDYAATEFVRRNRALIASRSEAPREFYFTFEDLRVGAGFKPARGEKDEIAWRTHADAKGAENVVDLGFYSAAETEYRCWVYLGGCCAEILSCTAQVFEGEEPVGEPAPVRPPSMQYKTHEAHAGRGRPVIRWSWVAVPVSKSAQAGPKKVRLSAPLKGFYAAEALVSATRPGVPAAAELRELERIRMETRSLRDPSLVGHWKLAEGSGPAAVDSGPFGVDAKLMGGAAWTPGTASPWSPPSIKFDGTGYLTLGSNLTLLQNVPGWTMAAWICPDKLSGAANQHDIILAISRHNATGPTLESRATLSLTLAGCLHSGTRVVDSGAGLSIRTAEKVAKAGVWTHVVVTCDYASNSMALYVNGVHVMTGTVNFGGKKSTPNTPSAIGAIGADDDGTAGFFKGSMSDVRVYNRALSKDEVADIAVPPR